MDTLSAIAGWWTQPLCHVSQGWLIDTVGTKEGKRKGGGCKHWNITCRRACRSMTCLLHSSVKNDIWKGLIARSLLLQDTCVQTSGCSSVRVELLLWALCTSCCWKQGEHQPWWRAEPFPELNLRGAMQASARGVAGEEGGVWIGLSLIASCNMREHTLKLSLLWIPLCLICSLSSNIGRVARTLVCSYAVVVQEDITDGKTMRWRDSKYVFDGEMKCERQSRSGNEKSLTGIPCFRRSRRRPPPRQWGQRPPADWKMIMDWALSKTRGLGKGMFFGGVWELFPSVYSCLA